MAPTTGILALITDPALRAEVDRVTAAAGIAVVHASEPSTRKVWSGAVAVLLDESAARRCAQQAFPRREHVVLVTDVSPRAEDWEAAIAVGAQLVVTLPGQDGELMTELTVATGAAHADDQRGAVVAVVAGRGGAGASVFATALAKAASSAVSGALLCDVDPWGGGIDLVAGTEAQAGLRWPDLDLQGGRLAWAALRDALPHHGEVRVLSCSRTGNEVGAAALGAVIDAGCRGGATVVCDVPRRATAAAETALAAADLVTVVTPADVRSCAASAAVGEWVSTLNPNVGLLVRGPSPGGLRAAEVASIVGLPLLAAMRPQPGLTEALERGGLRFGRRSPLSNAAQRVLAVLQQHPVARAA